MIFTDLEFLYLLLMPLILWFLIKYNKQTIDNIFSTEILKKISVDNYSLAATTRLKILTIAFTLIIISLARPVVPQAEIQVKTPEKSLIVAIDMSKSMFATDIYPNRFEFAKNKLLRSFFEIKNFKISILGFTNQSFLISPLTSDFNSLKFLIENLSVDNISLQGTNILNILKSSLDFMDSKEDRNILLLTDGGDDTDFSLAIKYAQEEKIKVFIYDISTTKGGIIKEGNNIVKDKNNNIVIVKTNQFIKKLASNSGGSYIKYQHTNSDLSDFINAIKTKETLTNSSITNNQELFYWPLILALILMFMTFFSLPSIKK